MSIFRILATEAKLRVKLLELKHKFKEIKMDNGTANLLKEITNKIDSLEKRVKNLENGKTFVEIEVELEPDIYEYVRKESEKTGKTMSDIVVDAITSMMKLYEKNPDRFMETMKNDKK